MTAHNPAPPLCQEKNAPGFTPVEKLWRVQWIIRRGGLDPFAKAVLLDVWDKSTAWGKEWAYVSMTGVAVRCQVSRRKVVYALKDLQDRGILDVRATRGKNGYRINYEGLGDMGLGTKGRVVLDKIAEEVVHDVHSASAPGAPNEGNNKEREEQEEGEPTARRLRDLIDYNLRHVDKTVTGGTLAKTWKLAWSRSGFAIHTPARELTAKEQGQLAHLRKPWPWDQRELHFFLAWVITDWQTIVKEMSWMRSPPEQPGPGFVLAMREKLMDMWAAKVRYDFTADLSNDRLDRLMAGGMSERDALTVTSRRRVSPEPEKREQRQSEAAWGSRPPVAWRNR